MVHNHNDTLEELANFKDHEWAYALRVATIGFLWLEFFMCLYFVNRQNNHVLNSKLIPRPLQRFRQYTAEDMGTSAAMMKQICSNTIQRKLYETCIWTVVISCDWIPFVWADLQLAESNFDFTPNFLSKEIRHEISFGFWFSVFYLYVLELPDKLLKHQLKEIQDGPYLPFRFTFRQKFEEQLSLTVHHTLLTFFLAIFVHCYDSYTSSIHDIFKPVLLFIGYVICLFVYEYCLLRFSYADRETFRHLEEGPLKEMCQRMCKQTGFPVTRIYIQDVPRDTPLNAYCVSYFGYFEVIVFISTIIEGYYDPKESEALPEETGTPEVIHRNSSKNRNTKPRSAKSPGLNLCELEGILAHEIGHWKYSHVEVIYLMDAFFFQPIVFIISMMLRESPLIYYGFGFGGVIDDFFPLLPGLMIAYLLICRPLNRVQEIVANLVGRSMESEADIHSVALKVPGKLQEGLIKLKKLLHGFPSSDPKYTLFYDHHPTLVDRIVHIDNHAHFL